MAYLGGVEPHAFEARLHDGPGGEGADQGPHAHGAPQQIPDQGGGAQQGDADGADGEAPCPPGQPHQQRIPGTAAQGRQHIGELGVGDDHQSQEHDGDAGGKGAAGLHQIQPVEEVHGLAHHHGVHEHGDADGLLNEQVDEQNRQGHGHGGVPVEDAQTPGQAQAQHVPGRRPQIGLNGQVDAEAVHEQADDRQQGVQQDAFRRCVFEKLLSLGVERSRLLKNKGEQNDKIRIFQAGAFRHGRLAASFCHLSVH